MDGIFFSVTFRRVNPESGSHQVLREIRTVERSEIFNYGIAHNVEWIGVFIFVSPIIEITKTNRKPPTRNERLETKSARIAPRVDRI